MINKIMLDDVRNNQIFKQNTNFRGTKKNNDPLYYSSSEYISKKVNTARLGATIIGLGVGAASKIAGKKQPLSNGVWAGLYSFIGLGLLSCAKDVIKNKKQNKQFEDKYQYNSKFDKFVGSFCVPVVPTQADKDFQQEYYNTSKKEQIDLWKHSLLPTLAIGVASSIVTGIACVAKKIPAAETWDKVKTIPLITATPVLLATSIGFNNKKEVEKQNNN